MPSFLANLVKKSIMFKLALILGLAHSAFFAFSIGPHQVALLVNDSSLDSVMLASYYSKLRGVPDSNVIKVSIPEEIFNPRAQIKISPEDFTKYVWEPFSAEIKNRKLENQILAVALSCDFPTTITTEPETSITGVLFAKNNLPPSDVIKSGQGISSIFAGPVNTNIVVNKAVAFDEMAARLGEKKPLLAMMIAYTGPRGMTYDAALQYVISTHGVDYMAPKGTVFFETNEDVRTKCRLWEYPIAQGILVSAYGVDVAITNAPPPVDLPIIGYMTGNRYVKPLEMQLAKGAFADHLTSFGAAFGEGGHTKITRWLEAGAGFSAGAVTEPYAIWSKFPSAVIFAHYLSGCTAIESYHLAVASPYQLLALGDPLVKPWATKFEVAMKPLPKRLSGKQILSIDEEVVQDNIKNRYYWLIDGKLIGTGKRYAWNTVDVKNGQYKVRLVVCQTFGTVRQQRFVEKIVVVAN
jgi:hypothetical protein